MILITGKTYDVLKFFALVLLPALGTAYFSLSGIWGLPSAEEVVGTVVVVDTFLGTILQLSSNAYAKSNLRFDGVMDVVVNDDGTKNFLLNLDDDPADLDQKDEIVFKVNKPE